MVTPYTIYLVNNSANTVQFWCFLALPDELVGDPSVFANSSTNLSVPPMSPAINTFTVPVQYVVGAGASNSAVGLNIRIDSSITQNTDLAQAWEVSYVTVPPNQGPTLRRIGPAPAGKISLKSNGFNQGNNEANGWFSNMSYGIRTNQGFIGMTWSPGPQVTRTLTPKAEFYIATGTFGSNSLASWTEVSSGSQRLTLADFLRNKTTVIYTEIGEWEVRPGAPQLAAGRSTSMPSLLHSHQLLAEAHATLVGSSPGTPASCLGSTGIDGTQKRTVNTILWDDSLNAPTRPGDPVLAGTLTVATALPLVFAAFVVSGVRLDVDWTSADGLTVKFSYRGAEGADFIRSLLYIGAQLLFVNPQQPL